MQCGGKGESGGLTTLTGGDTFHPMNLAELKKRLSSGFRPFAIRTTDGREFEIPHPEFMLIGKYSIAVRDKQGFISTLDPLHIISTRELSRRNGGG